VWLSGVALLGILGAGVTAAAVLLWENIDIRQLAPRLRTAAAPSPLSDASAPAARPELGFEAVLFESDRNRAFFPDTTFYRSELAAWARLIGEVGGTVRRAGNATDLRGLAPTDVLVLAEAPCLSDGEMAAVRAHQRRGGSMVANWAVGARDGRCVWRGWSAVAALTGAEDVREIPPRAGLFLVVPAGVALSAGFDPGTRIELRPDASLALRLSGPRVYWSDWALNPEPDESRGGADVAALATYSSDGGRIAWFGLRLSQAAAPSDQTHLERLIENGVLWAAGTPVAAVAPWPHASRAALVFTLDVEDEPRNALGMAELLRERGLPGTFFVVSRLVQDDRELAQTLSAAGEVASQTSDHAPVAGLTARDQDVRLRRSWSEIEAWAGRGPAGLHPPEESFDANTLFAWAAAGGDYILATNDARSAAPEVHRTQDGPVVLLPRLLKDDYNIIVQDRVLRAAGLGEALLAGTRKLRAIGGLAIVGTHTQIMRPGARLEAIGMVADSVLAQKDWWIASAGDVADWWAARTATRVRFVPAADGLADLLVEAPVDRDIVGVWIDIVLPGGERVLPTVEGRPVDFAVTEWGVRVPVTDLPAGATRRISLLLTEEGEGALPFP
jgi:peptidoglycan/xylan/chitin deacetylase (PgdA/CDA1 family)